jgi:hypothetical protein
LLTVSTPVIAVQPGANERSSSQMLTASTAGGSRDSKPEFWFRYRYDIARD